MRTVITYGTFDLFHEGHRRLLERARELGDRMIVGVTSESYDRGRGKLNTVQSLLERSENVRQTGLADLIIVEEYDGQKIHDIQKWGVDVFAIGSDWLGKFDHLRDYCEVVYLDRTRGVSSTQLRNESSGILRVGLVGVRHEARSLVEEARYVSGVSVEAVWDPDMDAAHRFAEELELPWVNETYAEMLRHVDAVFVSTPLTVRSTHVREALESGVHVLCEPPAVLTKIEAEALHHLAQQRELALVEGVRSAYAPGFLRMVAYARSGSIGHIRHIDVTSTRRKPLARQENTLAGGSITELAAYPILAVLKLLGREYTNVTCEAFRPQDSEVELFAKIDIHYPHALATIKVGTGVHSESALVVSGSTGHLYVPAPWWITEQYETRFTDARENQRFFVRFAGEGLRYELTELATRVRGSVKKSYKLTAADSIAIADVIERARAAATPFGIDTFAWGAPSPDQR